MVLTDEVTEESDPETTVYFNNVFLNFINFIEKIIKQSHRHCLVNQIYSLSGLKFRGTST